jgi:GNAT superfamily N-acetyltransferase
VDITTRAARADDLEFARAVHHAAYRDVVERQFGVWDEDFQDNTFMESWQDAAYEIVECGGRPCGYLCVEDRSDCQHVREIVISPPFQGRGIGTMLLGRAIRRATDRGVPVRLGTFHVNRAADLYRRLGFQETARTSTHILFEWHP